MSPDYRTPYTEKEVRQLKEWAELSAKTTGRDDRDSPARIAGDNFVEKVDKVRYSVDPEYSWPELSWQLGMKPDTMRAKMARRRKGGVDPSPSMKEYQDKPYNVNRKTATHFGCGCARIPDNTYWKPGHIRADGTQAPDVDYCRHHQLERLANSRGGAAA